jgi:hypothetical protein
VRVLFGKMEKSKIKIDDTKPVGADLLRNKTKQI